MVLFNKPEPDGLYEPGEDDDSETVTQRVIGWLWFLFKLGFILTLITAFVVTGAVIGVVKGFSEKIPIISDSSYRPNLTSQVYDVNGRLLAKLHAEENRTRILSAKEIPDNMRSAVVAIEDERFYSHYGIDLTGIIRAIIVNIKAGKLVQGASTLTQQLVKNAFLTSEKTFKRKAIEAMMAFQIERKYSKEEILTLYLNEIYFGHGAYGLAAAAELYYGKDPLQLTISECAALAGIPKSPVGFSPIRNRKRNEERRSLILSKMVELGFISPAEYEEAKKNPPIYKKLKAQKFKAPYFVTYVRDQLLEKYGANLLYNGGLKIHTTLDLEMQEYAEAAMASAPIFAQYPIDKYPGLNGSLICMDPKNGYIKALYGGRSFEQSQFNRVTQAYRQPGSSFKPFVYAVALEEGMLPNDKIVDEYISYINPWTKAVWTPKNYNKKFNGSVTVMKAICRSFNIPAIKLIDRFTPAKVIRLLKRMGITSQIEPNLSLALGTAQFTPMEMTSAYGVFANKGIYCRPLSILKVIDRDGNILENNLPRAKEVMKDIDAAMICDMLKIAVDRGTGARARVSGKVFAGKTGTTNNYIDAWFIGMSPDLVTTIQFGFDMPKSLGRGKSGGAVVGSVWKAFMSKATENYPTKDFPVPDNATRIRVCMVSGDLAGQKCPRSEVVSQIFPIESQPLTVCKHIRSVATTSVIDNDDESDAGAMFVPGADFFHSNYQNISQHTAPAVTIQAIPEQWIPRDKPVNESALERWGANKPIPFDAFIDDSLADAPAIEIDAPQIIREPGVIIDSSRPTVDFLDDYQ